MTITATATATTAATAAIEIPTKATVISYLDGLLHHGDGHISYSIAVVSKTEIVATAVNLTKKEVRNLRNHLFPQEIFSNSNEENQAYSYFIGELGSLCLWIEKSPPQQNHDSSAPPPPPRPPKFNISLWISKRTKYLKENIS